MTRAEFDKACVEICTDYWPGSVTDEMFDDINFVYTWYPTISETEGKEQIALLYTTFGFAIIQDMYPRASEALRLDKDECEVKEHLRSLQTKSALLRKGNGSTLTETGWLYVTDLQSVN